MPPPPTRRPRLLPSRKASEGARAAFAAVAGCAVLALAGAWAAAGADPTRDADTALREGNRLFRSGQLEAALESYASGWDPASPDPVLAYNLGTTAHHLGRLPEAVLWYRRALWAGGPEDRWLRENLAKARRRLGTTHPDPAGVRAVLAAHRGLLWALAAGLAWLWLAWVLLERHGFPHPAPRWLPWVIAGSALACFLLGALAPTIAPRPAVLLQTCGEGVRALPAGSEVWVTDATSGAYEVALGQTRLVCSAGVVEPVVAPTGP